MDVSQNVCYSVELWECVYRTIYSNIFYIYPVSDNMFTINTHT